MWQEGHAEPGHDTSAEKTATVARFEALLRARNIDSLRTLLGVSGDIVKEPRVAASIRTAFEDGLRKDIEFAVFIDPLLDLPKEERDRIVEDVFMSEMHGKHTSTAMDILERFEVPDRVLEDETIRELALDEYGGWVGHTSEEAEDEKIKAAFKLTDTEIADHDHNWKKAA